MGDKGTLASRVIRDRPSQLGHMSLAREFSRAILKPPCRSSKLQTHSRNKLETRQCLAARTLAAAEPHRRRSAQARWVILASSVPHHMPDAKHHDSAPSLSEHSTQCRKRKHEKAKVGP